VTLVTEDAREPGYGIGREAKFLSQRDGAMACVAGPGIPLTAKYGQSARGAQGTLRERSEEVECG
jgi:hypothetical protein